MLLLIIILALLILSGLIITPVIWCAFGKLFRIENLTFKKAFLTCLLLALIGAAFQIITLGVAYFKINNIAINIILFITSLVVTISILKIKFNTTVLKSIGLYVSTIVFAVCFALFIRTFVVQAFKIPAGSMKPTLLIGDHLLVNKFIYGLKIPVLDHIIIPVTKPKAGDIVVFKWPKDESKDFIKTVIGVEGDVIEIKNEVLFINGKEITAKYVGEFIDDDNSRVKELEESLGDVKHLILDQYEDYENKGPNGPWTVPGNSIFVMGDNRDNSEDSRYWGFVTLNKIKGKAFIIYFSWDKYNGQSRWDRIGNHL
jgi:signal peptidase I